MTYTVQSGYRAVKDVQGARQRECFRMIRDLKVPGTTKVSGWRVMLDKLPSRVNLEIRGITVPRVLCLLCEKEVETTHHLLINCEVVQRLWIKCDIWVGIISVRPNDIEKHFLSFYINGMSNKATYVWRGMWLAVVKEIWTLRNRIVFEDGQVDEEEVFVMAQLRA